MPAENVGALVFRTLFSCDFLKNLTDFGELQSRLFHRETSVTDERVAGQQPG
jgi:hypothetical protein